MESSDNKTLLADNVDFLNKHLRCSDIVYKNINDCWEILNVKAVASCLNVSTATVRNWAKCGYLPVNKGGPGYIFYKRDVEDVKLKLLNGELIKLNKRANKIQATKNFVPNEYVKNQVELNKLNNIIQFIQKNNIKMFPALLLVCLNLLKRKKILLTTNIQDVINKKLLFSNKQIQKEVRLWLLKIKRGTIRENFSFLLNCDLPEQRDVLGILYQSLLSEGKKSQSGAYYTPSHVVDSIIRDYVKKDSKVLDPCCGTGQFLLAFADTVQDPLNIYGVDRDDIAVRIARINLLIKFKNKQFTPNIFCKDILMDTWDIDKIVNKFDVIATNPPWGAHFSAKEVKELQKLYSQITSFESFSYFLVKSFNLLHNPGILSFVLPVSILNVKIHKDIRQFILKHSQIKNIICLGRIFKNVFTPVIRLDLKKADRKNHITTIYNKNKRHNAQQSKWIKNKDFIFNVHVNNLDSQILDKIYSMNHITLKDKASWALGIVTGNNKKFISKKIRPGFEPVYTGKEVKKFVLGCPSHYIQFIPGEFQQVAAEEKYRIKEKLIYKFISKNLVFAYDSQKRLTLNSANILIPDIPDYPLKVVAALFNSSLYQFIFQKKFSSIKVLRSHIEEMPLPLWNKMTFFRIIQLVDQIISNGDHLKKLDDYILSKFTFSQKEKKYIGIFISGL